MFSVGQCAPVTRARTTSNTKVSAAAIAVVSEVNPDNPGAFLFLVCLFLFLSTLFTPAFAQPPSQTQTAMNNASYNNNLITVTPMLFHHIDLGMNFNAILNVAGKSPVYCDSGESYCNAENGAVSKSCLQQEFIQKNKLWMCHWQGTPTGSDLVSNLEVWFMGDYVTHVTAKMRDGSIYRRDSGDTVHVERS